MVKSSTVERDKGFVFAEALGVDVSSEFFFSRPTFSIQEHGDIVLRHSVCLVQEFSPFGRFAHRSAQVCKKVLRRYSGGRPGDGLLKMGLGR
jgi:hypothetical protein